MLEIVATVLTVACVLLANFRSAWQYPIGIVGTIAFGYVVWSAELFANTGLQVFFLFIQLYGWWYWLRGMNGGKPRITKFEPYRLSTWLAVTTAVSLVVGGLLTYYSDAVMGGLDALVFGLSVFAQFLLDRKKLENWIVWAIVNVLSVYLYASQGLWVFTALYTGLLINTFIAYNMWKKEYNAYQA
jgi:nicotinamide mononucleotide transporter